MKLSVKASVLLAMLAFAVIAVTSFFFMRAQQQALRVVIQSRLESDTKTLAAAIRDFTGRNRRTTSSIAAFLPVEALKKGDLETVRSYLKKQLAFHPSFENGLFLLGKNGEFLTDYPTHAELKGQSFDHRDYYLLTMAGQEGVIGSPYISTRTGSPVLTFTAPVWSSSGEIEAVLCASVSLLSPSTLGEYQHSQTGENGFIAIVNQARQLVFHPDRSRLLNTIEPGRSPILDKALAGRDGLGETTSLDGRGMLVAAKAIPELGWVLLLHAPMEGIYQPVRAALEHLAFLIIAVLGIVVAIGVAAMGRITRPLAQLEHVAGSMLAEMGNQPMPDSKPFAKSALKRLRAMRGTDEIGQLSLSFFRLAVRLKLTLLSLRRAAGDWERTFNSVREAVLVLDGRGCVLRMNRAGEDLCRTYLRAAIGRPWRNVLTGGHAVPEEWPSLDDLLKGERLLITTHLPRHAGTFEVRFSHIQGRSESLGFLLIVEDVTDKLKAEERIHGLAFFDSLTGLPNRLLLRDRMEQALATADRNSTKVGVLFLDLDDFKKVNDTYGHDTGDELLKLAAVRLAAFLRINDTLARYAGDEFVAVLQDIQAPADGAAIAQRMVMALAEPFDIGDKCVRIGASIGMAIYPDDGLLPNLLISHADMAMYRAKGQGKNGLNFHEEDDLEPTSSLPPQ